MFLSKYKRSYTALEDKETLRRLAIKRVRVI